MDILVIQCEMHGHLIDATIPMAFLVYLHRIHYYSIVQIANYVLNNYFHDLTDICYELEKDYL